MITASVLLITFGLFGTLVALVIRQKAIAYRDDYRDELALGERALKGPANTRQHLKAESTRLRNPALARRKADLASVAHARKLKHA
ncbi:MULTISPECIES: hypothetical protein [Rhizobiaceae]|jgi:hypothetical protein|uniref:Uncharacterized protein n=1 Tax=Aliirhizobium cellulosilyticum TaxID=393664 RepID=A0A7W6UZP0_9HYPH|nr:hypothetical protein [Rhizobium cellulosilyticum]MBB4349146.1 hypothetical protein [Rhizobium cellulosilyticum]MBB4412633.1 hypothetical protein [Rhizobium cellulosilyticum]MBB4447265.1 hypothetical protein [Rhizobium cellulosilyticum]